jgi:hypothetical protein
MIKRHSIGGETCPVPRGYSWCSTQSGTLTEPLVNGGLNYKDYFTTVGGV